MAMAEKDSVMHCGDNEEAEFVERMNNSRKRIMNANSKDFHAIGRVMSQLEKERSSYRFKKKKGYT